MVILGGGESGVGAALLAKKNGLKVFLSDFGVISKKYKKELKNNKIVFEEGSHDIDRILKADLVIKSPGIPESSLIIKNLRKEGIKIISEIEYGSLCFKGSVIGVTGSNGKTTTTGLIYHLLKCAGKKILIGGNYGVSFCRQLLDSKAKIAVLELSSFQLDDIDRFRPNVAVMLNVSPDHLDRYNYDFEKYIDAKFRLLQNQKKKDLLIYNRDDIKISERIKQGNYKQEKIKVKSLKYINGISSKDGKFKLKLKGEHNLFNTYCAVEVARNFGLDDDMIQKALLSFKNVPHRLESVGMIEGVEFINDSKATNVDATYYALKAMDKKVIWIAGGVDKGNEYEQLFPLVRARVNGLICLGVDNEKLIKAFSGRVDVIRTSSSMEDCIRKAISLAYPGEAVLLAPACASFDLFDNYEDRGNQFRKIVNKINSE